LFVVLQGITRRQKHMSGAFRRGSTGQRNR
jgi:hypothetical protein